MALLEKEVWSVFDPPHKNWDGSRVGTVWSRYQGDPHSDTVVSWKGQIVFDPEEFISAMQEKYPDLHGTRFEGSGRIAHLQRFPGKSVEEPQPPHQPTPEDAELHPNGVYEARYSKEDRRWYWHLLRIEGND